MQQHSTKTAQEQQSHTPKSAENNPKENSSEIIEREQIENTPFWILKTEEGYFLVMGKYRLSETYPTQIHVLTYLQDNHWQIILTLCTIVYKTLQSGELNDTLNTMENLTDKDKKKILNTL